MGASKKEFDVVIVGAGLGGISMFHEMRARNFEVLVVEAGTGVGGTWFWNRYPGARCDIESVQYSFSFADATLTDWNWKEKYSSQGEIQRYIEKVAEHEGLMDHLRLNCRILSAVFDEDRARWVLETSDGDEIIARFCVMATGTLSAPNTPDLENLKKFEGEVYHTGTWPHEPVELAGKCVAVLGTGSSGVQLIPEVAKIAESVTVLQRTAPYVVPSGNYTLDLTEMQATRSKYPELRKQWKAMPAGIGMKIGTNSAIEVDEEMRRAIFEAAWNEGGPNFGSCFNDLTRNMDSNAEASRYFAWKIRQIIADENLAELLTPTFVWGTRRLCFGTNYYQTYNRANVNLVDLNKHPLERFTPEGAVLGGVEHKFDAVVLATGFDAFTGTLLRIDIRGINGVSLAEAWQDGPRSYLGLTVAGFPNFFIMSGPYSPSTLINVAVGSEFHADWIANCIGWMAESGHKTIEASPELEKNWVELSNEIGSRSLMSKGNSWWSGANIPGKQRNFLAFADWPTYRSRLNEAASGGYSEFIFRQMLEAPTIDTLEGTP